MICLRPYKPCDAECIAGWLSDEKVFYQWSAGKICEYPMSGEDLKAHYKATEDTDRFWPMSAYGENGRLLGHLIMRFTDDDYKKLRFGFIIVDSSIRGQGLGRRMLKTALKYAFEILNVDEVSLGVFANNERAYRCYLAAGFEEFGEREFYDINGESWECIELRILKENWC